MEGLEATEVSFSEMQANVRLDADFAAHSKAAWLGRLKQKQDFVPLASVLKFIGSGHTPYKHDVSQGEVGFITIESVDGLRFDKSKLKRITREQFDSEFKATKVTAGSVVCTIKRRICKAYPFSEEPAMPLAINQDVALLIPNDEIKPAYLAAYLSCNVGQQFADKQKTEQMNPYISVENLRTLPVCVLSSQFQNVITETFEAAEKIKGESVSLYTEAERTLLAELGLLDWQPPEALSYERRASEAFASGRLDAEYFSPRVQTLLQTLNCQNLTIGDVARLRKEYFNSARHETFHYIEISSLSGDGEADSSVVAASDAPDRATWYVRGNDVITSTVRPIRRLSALIHPEQDGYVCSSGFAVLKPRDVSPEVLLVYLRLPVVAELMDLHTTASMYPAISVPDILNIPFLPPSVDVAAQIVEQVRASRAARRQADNLLERAKRAVEVAIEDTETAALTYLDSGGE